VKTEHRLDRDELEILAAYDAGALASVASSASVSSRAERARFANRERRLDGGVAWAGPMAVLDLRIIHAVNDYHSWHG